VQYLEQAFFAYADQKASLALDNHLGVASRAWDSEIISAWSRFVIAMHLRHPDAMPELRAAAKEIRDASGADYQAAYVRIRAPQNPATFDELLSQCDPVTPVKMHVNLIIKALDNDIVGAHINKMRWAVLDVSAAPNRLLTSDRPVEMFNLKPSNGVLSLPISRTRVFVAVNEDATLLKLQRAQPRDLVWSSAACGLSQGLTM
jgi:hypothetical protein